MTTTMRTLVVLGAGTAGTMVVNKLRHRLPTSEWRITVVDKDDLHDYQPGYLFLPFGLIEPEQVRRTRHGLITEGVELVLGDVDTYDGALALRESLAGFSGGRLVVHVTEMPIKCPVAPLEFAFLADDFLRRRGLRDRSEIVYVTPLDGAFTKPVASRELGHLLADKGSPLRPTSSS